MLTLYIATTSNLSSNGQDNSLLRGPPSSKPLSVHNTKIANSVKEQRPEKRGFVPKFPSNFGRRVLAGKRPDKELPDKMLRN